MTSNERYVITLLGMVALMGAIHLQSEFLYGLAYFWGLSSIQPKQTQ